MSEQKRYTAHEMRESADCLEGSDRPYWFSANEWNKVSAMLRQAADAEEELAKAKRPDVCPANPTNKMCYLPGEYCCETVRCLQKENARLKARLDAVVKECERINDETFERSINKVVAYKTRVDVASDAICHRILRAARGEGGEE